MNIFQWLIKPAVQVVSINQTQNEVAYTTLNQHDTKEEYSIIIADDDTDVLTLPIPAGLRAVEFYSDQLVTLKITSVILGGSVSVICRAFLLNADDTITGSPTDLTDYTFSVSNTSGQIATINWRALGTKPTGD